MMPGPLQRISTMLVFSLCLTVPSCHSDSPPRGPTPRTDLEQLPRFRGFNLLEKFTVHDDRPYREEDFRLIAELGFNFVRLPLDYRCFTAARNPRLLKKNAMREIDAAIGWGERYGIHVCLNFHRAPGYCVNPPPEKTDLWEDPRTQETFAFLWGLFAARYRGIPSEQLSFNLINEPGEVAETTYTAVMNLAVAAIRKEDPNRLIVIDGLAWGTRPVSGITDPLVLESARGYAPMPLTHYRAPWVTGADNFPVPTWPIRCDISAYLYGPDKPDLHSPLEINLPAGRDTTLTILVRQVSARSRLVVTVDGTTVFEKQFLPGPGKGEWEKVVFAEQWGIYQNIYNTRYSIPIPAGAQRITIANVAGDWLLLGNLTVAPLTPAMTEPVVLSPGSPLWGLTQHPIRITTNGRIESAASGVVLDREWLRREYLAPWFTASRQGTMFMVGEFGAFNQTPHPVVLAWMDDLLRELRKKNIGWALWNFRGPFGILDSGRDDVVYEDFHGHKLDRAMLELLRRN